MRHAATLAERKGLGRARVAHELARRGAAAAAVELALAPFDTDRELATARETARRWLARRSAVAPDTRGRLLAQHLHRKGFGPRVIFRVLDETGAAGGESAAVPEGAEPADSRDPDEE